MFKCLECGAEFEEPEELMEPHGEIRTACPHCGSDDVEAGNACELCGAYTDAILCDSCWDELMTLDNAIDVGREIEAQVEINGFFEYYFDKKDINRILMRELRKELEFDTPADIKELCSDYFTGTKEERKLLENL